MSMYNPFNRGKYPVGVRTDVWHDKPINQDIPVEIWYPATQQYKGQDIDEDTQDTFIPIWVAEGFATAEDLAKQEAVRDALEEIGKFPLVLLIHGWAGYRRESTFIGTHLASHGYIVVSPDIHSSVFPTVEVFLSEQEPVGNVEDLRKHFHSIADARIKLLPFLISEASNNLDIEECGVGITGASFGGWTSLVAPTVDERIAAIAPMCPAAYTPNINENAGVLLPKVELNWERNIPAIMMVADKDSGCPLNLQFDILSQLPQQKKMVILANADHNHFVDDIETGQAWLKEFFDRLAEIYPLTDVNFPLQAMRVCGSDQLCPGDDAKKAWRGVIAALMDSVLKQDLEAQDFINGNIDEKMKEQGIKTYTVELR